MIHILWDASALAKRYVPEVGSSTVDALWASLPPPCMVATFLGYVETYGILLRKRTGGQINAASYATAKSSLRLEVINDPDFRLLEVETTDFLAGITLMDKYNINSSDAAFLAAYLRYIPPLGDVRLLVAADYRLLMAANAEGLKTLNPELLAPSDVPALLAGL